MIPALPITSDDDWINSGDAARNSRDCFTLALMEIRRRKFPEGWKPETDEERKLIEGQG